jgi:hypothetical protein
LILVVVGTDGCQVITHVKVARGWCLHNDAAASNKYVQLWMDGWMHIKEEVRENLYMQAGLQVPAY